MGTYNNFHNLLPRIPSHVWQTRDTYGVQRRAERVSGERWWTNKYEVHEGQSHRRGKWWARFGLNFAEELFPFIAKFYLLSQLFPFHFSETKRSSPLPWASLIKHPISKTTLSLFIYLFI